MCGRFAAELVSLYGLIVNSNAREAKMHVEMPRRFGARLLVAVAAAACVAPTDACGCVAAPSQLRVIGTVRDSTGAAVSGARVAALNRPVGYPNTPFSTVLQPVFFSDSLGRFSAVTASPSPGQHDVRVTVVRRGASDTLVLSLGVAALRSPRGPIDTLRLAVVLP